ncbi:MAG: polyamine aminopropyltransferase [Deltaproteobacteria bacterium]|nr:polyamine aminopropyltransferase [Deltaproteobacteria bacterium]
MAYALLFSIFIISTCGLVYELTAGALASYLLGDSITQFSIIIGVYLSAMGLGSYLSKHIVKNIVSVFIEVELLIGLVGGCSAAVLFALFEVAVHFRPILYSLISVTGVLVGLEIPLIMRVLRNRFEFKDLVSKVFTFDYIGALFASLLFPLILVPHLGLIRSSFMFGIINVLVALWALHLFRGEVKWPKGLAAAGGMVLLLLVSGFIWSGSILHFTEALGYKGDIIYAKTTKYQRIVLIREGDGLELFLNGNLQFSSRDEYRYHEALIHPGLQSLRRPKDILVLGGGDGLAVREILKYGAVDSVTLVDLDAEITKLFKSHETLVRLNKGSLDSPKVKIVNADAFVWMKTNERRFDFIAVDFPDPSNFSLGKLYTNTFYRLLSRALNDDGVIVVQSTSPFMARRSFWCVVNTLKSVGLDTTPYHAYLPSFGEWGYIIASKRPFIMPEKFMPGLRFISPGSAKTMTEFPPDMGPLDTEVNRLNNQALVRYFEEEWATYVH